VIKGVLTADDARRSVDEGATAIVVSNHGGRQLDGVPSTIKVLPEIIAAVGTEAEILMDGGTPRGSDIVKSICSGARGCLDRSCLRLRIGCNWRSRSNSGVGDFA